MRNLYFEHEIDAMYEEMLNDCHDSIDICGYTYEAGHALKEIDPIAFRCGVSDWSSEEFVEVSYDDMTDEERKKYIVSEHQIMFCRDDENIDFCDFDDFDEDDQEEMIAEYASEHDISEADAADCLRNNYIFEEDMTAHKQS